MTPENEQFVETMEIALNRVVAAVRDDDHARYIAAFRDINDYKHPTTLVAAMRTSIAIRVADLPKAENPLAAAIDLRHDATAIMLDKFK